MATAQEQQYRAQALDMAVRTPDVNAHNVLKLAGAYLKFIVGETTDNATAIATNLETITFEQFVQYGRANGANIVGGMPWSFKFRGRPVTHENDTCYLIMGAPGQDLRFTSDELLVVNPDGSLATIKAESPRL
jgi:hypothetical protein